jgi:hypothetical protein
MKKFIARMLQLVCLYIIDQNFYLQGNQQPNTKVYQRKVVGKRTVLRKA